MSLLIETAKGLRLDPRHDVCCWLPPRCYGQEHTPRRVVVHAMGEFIRPEGGLDYWAREYLLDLGLSAHALICPSGTVIRLVPEGRVAYHAKGHNEGSLGVELLVSGAHNLSSLYEKMDQLWLTPWAYDSLKWLVSGWMKTYDIPSAEIYRHSDLDPKRKRDPGDGFPWKKFKAEVSYEYSAEVSNYPRGQEAGGGSPSR